jgi:hypothetical protein
MEPFQRLSPIDYQAAPCLRWLAGLPCYKVERGACDFAHSHEALEKGIESRLHRFPHLKESLCKRVEAGKECKRKLLCLYSHRNHPEQCDAAGLIDDAIRNVKRWKGPRVSRFSRFKQNRRDKSRVGRTRKVVQQQVSLLCLNFFHQGVCKFGRGCRFPHGDAAIAAAIERKLEVNPSYKTRSCLEMKNLADCKNGSNCQHIHGKRAISAVTRKIEKIVLQVRAAQRRESMASASEMRLLNEPEDVRPLLGVPIHMVPDREEDFAGGPGSLLAELNRGSEVFVPVAGQDFRRLGCVGTPPPLVAVEGGLVVPLRGGCEVLFDSSFTRVFTP